MSPELVAASAKIGLWLVFLIQVAPIMNWVERRVPAFMQDRLGPNRVGPLGLFQTIADAAKFIFKEDIEPTTADRGGSLDSLVAPPAVSRDRRGCSTHLAVGTSSPRIGRIVSAPRNHVSRRPRAWRIRSVKTCPRCSCAASWTSSIAKKSTPRSIGIASTVHIQ